MNTQFAEKLIEMRRVNNLTQEQLADKINVSRQAISKWERAEASPDTDNLIALAKLFNVSLDYLLDYNYKSEEKSKANEGNPNFTYNENTTWGNSSFKDNKKQDDKSTININANGIHLKDGDNEISINPFSIKFGGSGINFFENGEDKNFDINSSNKNDTIHFSFSTKLNLKEKAISTIFVIFSFLSIVAYIALGLAFGMWHPMWLILLAPYVVTSCLSVKRLNANIIFLVTIIYLTLGFVGNIWHPGWVVFLIIPFYYILGHSIKRIRNS